MILCVKIFISKDHPVYKLAKIEQLDGEYCFYFQLPLIGEEITLCEFKDDILTLGFDSSHSYNNMENSKEEQIRNSTIKMFEQCKVYNLQDVENAKIKKITDLQNLLNNL